MDFPLNTQLILSLQSAFRSRFSLPLCPSICTSPPVPAGRRQNTHFVWLCCFNFVTKTWSDLVLLSKLTGALGVKWTRCHRKHTQACARLTHTLKIVHRQRVQLHTVSREWAGGEELDISLCQRRFKNVRGQLCLLEGEVCASLYVF